MTPVTSTYSSLRRIVVAQGGSIILGQIGVQTNKMDNVLAGSAAPERRPALYTRWGATGGGRARDTHSASRSSSKGGVSFDSNGHQSVRGVLQLGGAGGAT